VFWKQHALTSLPFQINKQYCTGSTPVPVPSIQPGPPTHPARNGAWSNRDTGITYLVYDPFILRYKEDPRFVAFCRKVGLPVPGSCRAQVHLSLVVRRC